MQGKKNAKLSFYGSLRGRLIVLVCIATLPATLFTFYVANAERTASLNRSVAEANYVAELISRQHVSQIQSAKTLLRWLAAHADADRQHKLFNDQSYLSALLAGFPQLANIAVVNPDGDVVSSAYPLDRRINMRNYEAIQRALSSSQPESGVYVIGPIVKRPLLHLAQSIRNSDGRVTGVAFVALDLQYLNDLFSQVRLSHGEVVQILDRDGNVLASSSANQKLKPENSVTMPLQDMTGLRIVSSLPHDKIRAAANATFLRFVGLLSLLTLFTVASVVFLEEIALLRYLRMLANASRRFGEGDYSVRMKLPKNYGELERMAGAFNAMASTLDQRHKELNELTTHLQLARESERSRIARDLHDEVGQVLTSIKLDLAGQPSLDSIRQKLDQLVVFVREIASSLRPPALDGVGLSKALFLLARNTERNSNLIINVDCDVEEPLDWLTSTTIYRIVQESLTNILKHANATEANIEVYSDGSDIFLSIVDDGKGYSPPEDAKARSLGVIGMRERAKTMQGSFAIFNNGSGTTVEASFPRNHQVDKICVSF